MSDRPDETGEKRDAKRSGADVDHSARSMREVAGRTKRESEARDGKRTDDRPEPGRGGAEGGRKAEVARPRERDPERIAAQLRDNAEFQRRAQGQAAPSRRDAAAEARRTEANRGRIEEVRRDRTEFQRQWAQAGEAARREVEPREYEWVSRGVRHERVAGVDRAEFAGTWDSQKTHKYTREGIETALRTLPEVRGRLDAGAKPDEIKALHASPDPREREIARTYDSFYGSDAITIERDAEGRTKVLNGRHRLDSADQMGLDDLPMHVVEQVRRERERDH